MNREAICEPREIDGDVYYCGKLLAMRNVKSKIERCPGGTLISVPGIIDFVFSADRDELVALLTDMSGRPDLAAVVKLNDWMMARAARAPNNLMEARRMMAEAHEALAL